MADVDAKVWDLVALEGVESSADPFGQGGEPPPDPASWNLPATLNVQQSGNIPLRQYAVNATGWTISVSGLPTGVTYNGSLERLEGASTGTASATATFTLSLSGQADVVDTATVALVSSEYPEGYYPSNYELELVSPRAAGTAPSAESGTPTMPSGHRIFKAYPGIEYNIRAVVIGGAYPYTFSLSNAPAGMTINARTGEISWPNPQANAEPTITVRDMEGTERSSSWAITVTTSGFRFVDSVNGDDSNAGTLAAPWQTYPKVFNTTSASDIIYYRSGSYNHDGLTRATGTLSDVMNRVEINSGSRRWIAYPGESVTFDCRYINSSDVGATYRFSPDATNPRYFDGIRFTNHINMLTEMNVAGNYDIVRNVTMDTVIGHAGSGTNPSAMMFTGPAGETHRWYFAVQDYVCRDMAKAGAWKTYNAYKILFEDCEIYNCTESGPDIKARTGRWEVRNCRMYDNGTAGGDQYDGLFGNMNGGPAPSQGRVNNGEVRYNYIKSQNAGDLTIDINQDGNHQELSVYRNTFVGGTCRIRNLDGNGGDNGPFRVFNNVVQNPSAGWLLWTGPFGGDGTGNSNVVFGASNGGGAASDLAATSGLVDDSGALIGANRTTYLNQRGHEIAES